MDDEGYIKQCIATVETKTVRHDTTLKWSFFVKPGAITLDESGCKT